MVGQLPVRRTRLALLGALASALVFFAAEARAFNRSFEFSIKATGQSRAGQEAAFRLLFGLAVPLDELFVPSQVALGMAAPPEGAASSGGAAEDAEGEPPSVKASPVLGPTESAQDEPRSADPDPRRDGASRRRASRTAGEDASVPRLDPRLGRATVRAVMRAQGRTASTGRLDSLASRSNTSAWLPDLLLSVGRSTDETLRLNPTIDDPYRYTQSGGSDLWGEVRLTWKLGRLIFASDELAVERIRVQREKSEEKLISRVLDVLFEWHRARVVASDETALPEERDQARLRGLEAELILDVLSDGWFSARVQREEERRP